MEGNSLEISQKIARPIPMKRELKGMKDMYHSFEDFIDCKAHPDEKGTESWQSLT